MTNQLSIQMKLLISLLTASIGSALITIYEYYHGIVIENRVFLILMLSVYCSDVVFGIWAHLKKNDFSFRELLIKALMKMVIAFFSMIIFNAMAGIEGIGETAVKPYLLMVGKLLTMTYFAGSAFNNMYFITSGKFPPLAWMKKMKEFNKSLDVSSLKSPSNEPTQN